MRRRWRAGAVMLAALLAACGTNAPVPDVTPLPTAANVRTCGAVVRAVIDAPPCATGVNTVCLTAADYDPDALQQHTITQGTLDSLPERLNITETVGRWESYALFVAPEDSQLPVTLVTIGGVTLENITPALDVLTLETAPEPACTDAPAPALLVQSLPDTQANLTINGVQITVGAAAALTAAKDDVLTVYTLDGLSVVSAGGVTRVVRVGEQLTVPLDGLSASGAPVPAVRAGDVDTLPADALPNPISTPSPVPQTRAEQIRSGNCTPEPSWTGEYAVQRGDSLARIAPVYGLTYKELQDGNCLLNPNRLRPGDVLRVPAPPATATAVRTQPPAATGAQVSSTLPPNATVIVVPAFSDSGTALTVDDSTISAGACTTLRWSVSAAQVYLDELPVSASGTRQVCPQITTVYTLRTVNPNNTYTAAVFVE